MSKHKNILFIMADQLRWDYLSCYGHPYLQTPNIDRLANMGVRFDRAYCNSPLCAPSRASFYTGRSMFSTGTYWNSFPIKVTDWTIGDYLEPLGYRCLVVGKTDTAPDLENMSRLGIDPESKIGQKLRHGGFEPFERDDGLHPHYLSQRRPQPNYNHYLRENGYDHPNPWQHHANSALDEHGKVISGWYMQNNNKPANIDEEHSETPYMTRRAMDCIESMGDTPWCLHLSFIKPHWPYHAPAPYHEMYTKDEIVPRLAKESEKDNPHPVMDAFMRMRGSQHWARDEVRETVIPAYMGLVKQIDDQIGRLLTFLEEKSLMDQTMIVFTSDHGDYLGDHWLHEKDTFHEPSIRIPLIIYDPSLEADQCRGIVNNQFVTGIDLLPTFIDFAGGKFVSHRLEGQSLVPFLHGDKVGDWPDFVVSETGYAGRMARHYLGLEPWECRGYMVRTERWKYILWEGFAPQLFDLIYDPNEFIDLGQDPKLENIRQDHESLLFKWMRHRKLSAWRDDWADTTIGPFVEDEIGILIGYWEEGEGPQKKP